MLNTANQSLAFTLAARGHDVWLANSRGTKYGLRHETLTPDQSEFWDFSFEEMASYDLPAVVDLITNCTGKTIHFVGHSQGEYNGKLTLQRIRWHDITRGVK